MGDVGWQRRSIVEPLIVPAKEIGEHIALPFHVRTRASLCSIRQFAQRTVIAAVEGYCDSRLHGDIVLLLAKQPEYGSCA